MGRETRMAGASRREMLGAVGVSALVPWAHPDQRRRPVPLAGHICWSRLKNYWGVLALLLIHATSN